MKIRYLIVFKGFIKLARLVQYRHYRTTKCHSNNGDGANGCDAAKTKERAMKSKYFENGLAVLGAVVILVGVSFAANTALAGNQTTVEIHGLAHR